MRTLLDALPEPLVLLDMQGQVLHINQHACRWIGLSPIDLPGLTLQALCTDDAAVVASVLRQGSRSTAFTPARLSIKRNPQVPCRCEITRVEQESEPHSCLLLRFLPSSPDTSRFLLLNERIDALSREIARRIAVENALREQGEWLRVVLLSIGDAVIATDENALVVLMNPVAEKLCGWPESQARGQPIETVFPIIHSVTRRPATDPVRKVLLERRLVGLDPHTLLLSRSGAEVPIDDAAGPIFDSDHNLIGVVLVFREITERLFAEQSRRVLENQLRNAQKMEAVGTLAGGIAHDFNNVLGAILANNTLAQASIPPDHPAHTQLMHISRAGNRARELIRQIMTFSRRQPQQLRRHAVQPIVEECLSLLRSTLPSSAQIRVQLASEPMHVLADATQFTQVLMNLCTNAWQSLRGSTGLIAVTLDTYQGDPPDGIGPGFGAWRPGPYARVTVTDNGCGMDPGTLQRVFEPFFTTKPKGEGTGLGLAVAHGIIAEHRGFMTVRSSPNMGTRFDLLLPLLDPIDADLTPLDVPAPPPVPGLGRHVMYIDDDEVLVATVEALLTRSGFRVSAFASPALALSALSTSHLDVDVVVSDFNMPEFTGLDIARQVALVRPGLPVIVSSGYLSDDLHQGASAAGVSRLLNKEDTYSRLPAMIDELLPRS